jgi:rubrerythrin
VESLKNIMEHSDIPCTIKNQQTAGLAGEVPFVEVFPELWVLRDEDLENAKDILENWGKAKPAQEREWLCPNCGETIEKEFTACWNCGTDQPLEDW